LGQTYNGQIGKGIGIWSGLILFYALMIAGIDFFSIPLIIIWAYGVYDAYSTANKINAGQIMYTDTNVGHIIGFVIVAIIIGFVLAAFIAGFITGFSSNY
jgi:hypothetical protein